eukprot:3936748-Rhodomonas_salina.5
MRSTTAARAFNRLFLSPPLLRKLQSQAKSPNVKLHHALFEPFSGKAESRGVWEAKSVASEEGGKQQAARARKWMTRAHSKTRSRYKRFRRFLGVGALSGAERPVKGLVAGSWLLRRGRLANVAAWRGGTVRGCVVQCGGRPAALSHLLTQSSSEAVLTIGKHAMQSHEVPCSALLRLGNQNQSAEYMRVRRQVLENTYIMKPQEHEKFRANEVIKAVKALLDERLKGKRYDSNESAQLSKELCTEIKEKVKEIGAPRHKLVVQVLTQHNNFILFVPLSESSATSCLPHELVHPRTAEANNADNARYRGKAFGLRRGACGMWRPTTMPPPTTQTPTSTAWLWSSPATMSDQ